MIETIYRPYHESPPTKPGNAWQSGDSIGKETHLLIMRDLYGNRAGYKEDTSADFEEALRQQDWVRQYLMPPALAEMITPIDSNIDKKILIHRPHPHDVIPYICVQKNDTYWHAANRQLATFINMAGQMVATSWQDKDDRKWLIMPHILGGWHQFSPHFFLDNQGKLFLHDNWIEARRRNHFPLDQLIQAGENSGHYQVKAACESLAHLINPKKYPGTSRPSTGNNSSRSLLDRLGLR